MEDNKKAAEILNSYRQFRNNAADVSADLLFSTAVTLACPWHMPSATATGMAMLGEVARQESAADGSEGA